MKQEVSFQYDSDVLGNRTVTHRVTVIVEFTVVSGSIYDTPMGSYKGAWVEDEVVVDLVSDGGESILGVMAYNPALVREVEKELERRRGGFLQEVL